MIVIRASLAALLLLLFANCQYARSISYHRAWKKESSHPRTTHPTDLTGAWTGSWKSNKNGHHGKLKCLIAEPAPSSSSTPNQETLHFHYWASWATLLQGTFAEDFVIDPKSDHTIIQGTADLGTFGRYQKQGHGTPTHLTTTYRGMGDHGTMTLQRP